MRTNIHIRNTMLILLIAMLVLSTGCYEQEKDKVSEEVPDGTLSWANMKVDDESLKLTDEERDIIKYFDIDYMSVFDYDNLINHSEIYKNAQIKFKAVVEKIIKNDDDSYECIVRWLDEYYDYDAFTFNEDVVRAKESSHSLDKGNFVFLEGQQNEYKISEGDIFFVNGRCLGTQSKTVDDKVFELPSVSANYTQNFTPYSGHVWPLYNHDYINEITKEMFGSGVKIEEAPDDYIYECIRYVVTPEVPDDSQIKQFLIDTDRSHIEPIDISKYKDVAEYYASFESVNNSINVAADFEHLIYTTQSYETGKSTLTYYDKKFNVIWEREFDSDNFFPYDYTVDTIYIVGGGKLHSLDTKTGEDKMEPVEVGEKVRVNASENGIVLIGMGKEDNVMLVDYEGEIKWNTTVDTDVYYCYSLQVIDGNILSKVADFDASQNTYMDSDSATAIFVDTEGNVLDEFVDND